MEDYVKFTNTVGKDDIFDAEAQWLLINCMPCAEIWGAWCGYPTR